MTGLHANPNALRLYASALLADKLYTANIFGDYSKEDIAFWRLLQGAKNNPETAWKITIESFPYLQKAVEEVEKQIGISTYLLSYWQILDGIVWAIEEEPRKWQETILSYVTEFLAPPITPRNKFRQAIQVIECDSKLQGRAKLYSWSTRHLAYKLLRNSDYRYLHLCFFNHRPVGYWLKTELN